MELDDKVELRFDRGLQTVVAWMLATVLQSQIHTSNNLNWLFYLPMRYGFSFASYFRL